MSDIINLLFANIIRILHILLVAFVLIAPFLKQTGYIVLHITLCISLLIHWYNNSDMCSLSLLESRLRGVEYTDTFMHQIVSPVYNINDALISKICYIVVLILLCTSVYKLIKSGVLSKIRQEIHDIPSDLKFNDKLALYTSSLSKLFIVT